jgi:tRNA nucleotidyltransferase (CCA-adding enzyme)
MRQRPYPQAELLRSARQAAAAVTLAAADREGLSGEEIGKRLRRRRLAALRARA